MKRHEIKVSIPHYYIWGIGKMYQNKELFIRYVKSYIKKVHHDYELIDIKGVYAICVKKEDDHD